MCSNVCYITNNNNNNNIIIIIIIIIININKDTIVLVYTQFLNMRDIILVGDNIVMLLS